MDTRTMIEERVKLNEDARAMLDRAGREGRTLNHDEQQTFDRTQARINSLRSTLDAEALVAGEERYLSESRGRQTATEVRDGSEGLESRGASYGPREFNSAQDLAFRAWALGNRATAPMAEAAQRVGVRVGAPELDLRALSVGTGSAGGNAVGNEIMQAYFEAQKWYGRVRDVSTVFSTATGASLPIPVPDDTANTGEIIAEAGAVTTTVDPTFGQVVLKPFKYSSKAVIVSVELLQDSFINLPAYLGQALGTRIGRKQNTDFTLGVGTTEPNGVQVRASLGKTAASATAITVDEVIDLMTSVDVAYRARPNVRFMAHDTITAYLRKLKDGQGRYLWETSTQLGQPDRLFGYPVVVNNDMDSALTTNKRLLLFGDFGSYVIQDAGAPMFIRADELRVLNHQSVFLAMQRSDGNLVDTAAVKYLRTA
jgi:HK97 family phage major capsid protein